MKKLRTRGLLTFISARSLEGKSGGRLSLSKVAGAVFVFCIAAVIASPAQTFKTLVNFDGTDGSSPQLMSLVQGTDGNFYGTTYSGGANGLGTVFRITSDGTITTLHSFDNTDGAYLSAGLVQAENGDFYGATFNGGNLTCTGSVPWIPGCGTLFKITPGGKLTTLHCFEATDGTYHYAVLVQGTDGNFYGTTGEGGAGSACSFGFGCGTVFKINPGSKLTTVYSFCSLPNCTDGSYLVGGLVQATNGDLYGTASGANGSAILSGKLTTLHSFCSEPNCTDGYHPIGGLLQATNGDFYGATPVGGADGDGTIFSLSVGLGPFVTTRPNSGKVGTKVIILGNNLTRPASLSLLLLACCTADCQNIGGHEVWVHHLTHRGHKLIARR